MISIATELFPLFDADSDGKDSEAFTVDLTNSKDTIATSNSSVVANIPCIQGGLPHERPAC